MQSRLFKNYKLINKRHRNAIAQRERANKMGMFRLIREDVSSYFEKWEPKLAPYLKHIKRKRIIVPRFGDGLVMLAYAKKGAIVIDVDLSREQIRFAKETAKYCGVKVNLVEADWQNLPKSILKNFDLVVTECGIFIWIADLDAWMKNAFRVLKRYGKLIVSDFHPLSIITEEKDEKLTFRRSYFDQSPEICKEEGNIPPSVEFRWKLSDIINAESMQDFVSIVLKNTMWNKRISGFRFCQQTFFWLQQKGDFA